MSQFLRDTTRPTWNELVEKEPRLNDLLRKAKEIKDPGPSKKKSFCANKIWRDEFKWQVEELVGWYAKKPDPLLSSSKAYDVAYQTIYGELPACRNCYCL